MLYASLGEGLLPCTLVDNAFRNGILFRCRICDGAPAIASGLLAKGRRRRSNRLCGDTPAEGHWNLRDGSMRRRLRDDVTYLSLGYLGEN